MLSKPTVCAVMLVNGREAMAARAIRSFRAQTYERKRLLLWDSTPELICCDQTEDDGVYHVPAAEAGSIGALRNAANSFWTEFPIIAHWDSDDWSHPQRFTEQVELLERGGKECVGYNEMLFWRQVSSPWLTVHCKCGYLYPRSGSPCPKCHTYADSEAWLYRLPLPGYALGTSLMYWRKAWERNPFEDKSNGEDAAFLKKVSCASASACAQASTEIDFGPVRRTLDPRMIATVHGGNTATVIDPSHSEWKRVPEWDERVRAIMEGA